MLAGFFGLQTTISSTVRVEGIGVHSGRPAAITFQPAEANTGIVFERYQDGQRISAYKAVTENVGPTALCTVLGDRPETWVATVEHVMAALYAYGIDNVVIAVEGGEMPIMDGSSRVFVNALEDAGIVKLTEKRGYLRVMKTVRVESGAGWAEFSPFDGMRFDVEIDFDTPVIGRQRWAGNMSGEVFRDELAGARTFGFMRDVEQVWARGFALGSSLENSVVISDDDRVINPEGLRFKDEFARHKTLDAVGDVAMMGMRFAGCFRSYRGGHALNAKAVQALFETPGACVVTTPRDTISGFKRREDAVAAEAVS
ncbi:UDP-3-O-acyl-N-acetylglucosamine deacetylase [Martelella mediterranea]|uniref:UDP-3-O-acyl-N-acetylglucosamine deacetylase n=1 Tax=Martelella mediterranea TaxID=293089 RepID=A0A4R3P1M3_9HYPH|nr:UDP-3-O-acyl-N-acetylglucosamine deacetylase [Martelella mediterranea]TCT43159.1 UDP-3-O-[3-hydroxymyristoyl] N-acetylglucosamine deacetylase [Martelella mediterranea]